MPNGQWLPSRSRGSARPCSATSATPLLRQTGAPSALCVTIRAVDAIESLASRLPRGAVTTDPQMLRERAIDSWTLGLLRRVRGDEPPEPAAVVFPTSTEDVATVLSWASPMRIPVITRGGGSGVCGGASGAKASVVLDMSRMDKVTDVDLISRVVHVQAGVRGDQLEDVLAADGLTVGHYPQSLAMSTVGGWIAASSAGQASTGFGAIEDMLLGLTAVLPTGRVLRCRPVPRSAAGPDLRRLLVGSEGTFAVVTEATLACRPRPAGWQWLAFGFPTFDALADGLRDAVRAETGAVICRGYDPTDAQLSFGPLGHSSGCVGLLGFPVGLPGLDGSHPARFVVRRPLVAAPQRRGGHLRQDHGTGPRVRLRGGGGHDGGRGPVVRRAAAVRGRPDRPGRDRAGGGLSPVPSVPVGLLALLHVPDQRGRRPGCGDPLPRGLGSGRPKLRGHGRDDDPPSRRGTPEVRVHAGRTRRDRGG